MIIIKSLGFFDRNSLHSVGVDLEFFLQGVLMQNLSAFLLVPALLRHWYAMGTLIAHKERMRQCVIHPGVA
jgi:hypothetical protein